MLSHAEASAAIPIPGLACSLLVQPLVDLTLVTDAQGIAAFTSFLAPDPRERRRLRARGRGAEQEEREAAQAEGRTTS